MARRKVIRCDMYNLLISITLIMFLDSLMSALTNEIEESSIEASRFQDVDQPLAPEDNSSETTTTTRAADLDEAASDITTVTNVSITTQPTLDVENLVRTQLGLGPSQYATLVSSEHDRNSLKHLASMKSPVSIALNEDDKSENSTRENHSQLDISRGFYPNHNYQFSMTAESSDTKLTRPIEPSTVDLNDRSPVNRMNYLYRLRGPITSRSEQQTFHGPVIRNPNIRTTTQTPRTKLNHMSETSKPLHPILAFKRHQLTRKPQIFNRTNNNSITRDKPVADADARFELPTGFVDFPNMLLTTKSSGIIQKATTTSKPEANYTRFGYSKTDTQKIFGSDPSQGRSQNNFTRLNGDQLNTTINVPNSQNISGQTISHTDRNEPLTVTINRKPVDKSGPNRTFLSKNITPGLSHVVQPITTRPDYQIANTLTPTVGSGSISTMASTPVTTVSLRDNHVESPLMALPSGLLSNHGVQAHHHHLHSHVHSIKPPIMPGPVISEPGMSVYESLVAAAAAAAAAASVSNSRLNKPQTTSKIVRQTNLNLNPQASYASMVTPSIGARVPKPIPIREAYESENQNRLLRRQRPETHRGNQQAASFWMNMVEAANRAMKQFSGSGYPPSPRPQSGKFIQTPVSLQPSRDPESLNVNDLYDQIQLTTLPSIVGYTDQPDEVVYSTEPPLDPKLFSLSEGFESIRDDKLGNLASPSEQTEINQRPGHFDQHHTQEQQQSQYPIFPISATMLPYLISSSDELRFTNEEEPYTDVSHKKVIRPNDRQRYIDWDNVNMTEMFDGSSALRDSPNEHGELQHQQQHDISELDGLDEEQVIFAPLSPNNDILIPIYTRKRKVPRLPTTLNHHNEEGRKYFASPSNAYELVDIPNHDSTTFGLFSENEILLDKMGEQDVRESSRSGSPDKTGRSLFSTIKSMYSNRSSSSSKGAIPMSSQSSNVTSNNSNNYHHTRDDTNDDNHSMDEGPKSMNFALAHYANIHDVTQDVQGPVTRTSPPQQSPIFYSSRSSSSSTSNTNSQQHQHLQPLSQSGFKPIIRNPIISKRPLHHQNQSHDKLKYKYKRGNGLSDFRHIYQSALIKTSNNANKETKSHLASDIDRNANNATNMINLNDLRGELGQASTIGIINRDSLNYAQADGETYSPDSGHIMHLVELVPDYAQPHHHNHHPASYATISGIHSADYESETGHESARISWHPLLLSSVSELSQAGSKLRPKSEQQRDYQMSESARVGVIHKKWSFLASFWPVLALMPIVIVLAITIQLILAAPLMVFAMLTLLVARLALLILGPLALRSDLEQLSDKSGYKYMNEKNLIYQSKPMNVTSFTNLLGLLNEIERKLAQAQRRTNETIIVKKSERRRRRRKRELKRYFLNDGDNYTNSFGNKTNNENNNKYNENVYGISTLLSPSKFHSSFNDDQRG